MGTAMSCCRELQGGAPNSRTHDGRARHRTCMPYGAMLVNQHTLAAKPNQTTCILYTPLPFTVPTTLRSSRKPAPPAGRPLTSPTAVAASSEGHASHLCHTCCVGRTAVRSEPLTGPPDSWTPDVWFLVPSVSMTALLHVNRECVWRLWPVQNAHCCMAAQAAPTWGSGSFLHSLALSIGCSLMQHGQDGLAPAPE